MILDGRTILADKQVIDAETYAMAKYDFKEDADYGIIHPMYLQCLTQGDFSNDIRVQVIGFADGSSDAIVIGDSGVIAKADLTAFKDFFVHIESTGKKYRYLTARIIPTLNGVVQGTANDTTPDISKMAGVTPIGYEPTKVANAIRIQLVDINPHGTYYKFANEDKIHTA